MSHELRTPLNAILGFAQLIESSEPTPSARHMSNITQILNAGWYLLKLINEVLDLAAIESNKLVLMTESVSLASVLGTCRNMVETQAQLRGIQMSFPSFVEPVFVRADRTRLEQVLINLLSNAVKYNKENGRVTVDCVIAERGRIRISVKDTGPGLPPEKLTQLFTPFNRLGQETGDVPGTGIGLVVSKRLTEAMEGTLGVESTMGEGSVFYCELRAADTPFSARSNESVEILPSVATTEARERTLLYVEDNPANLRFIEELTDRIPDLKLITAVNAAVGLELVYLNQPHVILMDINLPGISGIKALRILREDPATAHLPVIALSANAMPRDIENGLEAGFFSYLTKPVKIKEFKSTLEAALKFGTQHPLVVDTI